MTRRHPALVAIAVVLVLALAAPAGAAESTRRRRDAARAKRAEIARQMNALKASDAELEQAVSVLNGEVQAQSAKAEGARRAVAAAEAQVRRAEERIATIKADIEGIRADVVARARAAYMRPADTGMLEELASARDLNEAGRRSAVLAQVANRKQDAIDELRAARQDVEEEQARATQARELAKTRRAEVEARLGELRRARSDKVRLESALDDRIAAFQKMADEVAGEEAGLSNLIRSRDAAIVAGPVSRGGLIWPTQGRLTSAFGPRWGRLHAGLDIAAPTGTPIRAAKAGTVIFSGVMSGYGNVVVIGHGGGLSTLYAHQSRLVARGGASVAQGELIGHVGSTGRSTGPHVHFELRVGGSPQDPRRYL